MAEGSSAAPDTQVPVPQMLIQRLLEADKLTRNGASSANEELAQRGPAELIRRLLELNVNSDTLAATLGDITDQPVYPKAVRPSLDDGSVPESGDPVLMGSGKAGQEWVYCENGMLYFVNLLDARGMTAAVREVRRTNRVTGTGIISKGRFTIVAGTTGGEEDIGGGEAGRVKSRLLALMRSALRMGASDVHFIPMAADVRTYLRVENRLKQIEKYTYEEYLSIANVILTMTKKGKPGTYLSALDDQFIFIAPPNRTVKVRVMMVPVVISERETEVPRFCLRIPNAGIEKIGVRDLGIPDSEKNPSLTRLLRVMERKNGLILVSGPTGSGKTTTLMAVLAEKQRTHPDSCRYTVEDPVEFNLAGVSHVQVNEEAELTFARAIKSFLRGDPDEIMVGEIRDGTVGGLALTASITGHLTFATIHTNSAVECITRLVDMGCAPYVVADAMRASTAQRLVRRVCKACRVEARWGDLVAGEHPDLQHPDLFIQRLQYMHAPQSCGDLDDYPTSPDALVYIARTGGCEHCGFTGYKGRVLITEVLEITPKLAELIAARATTGDLRRQAIKDGFKEMWQHGAQEIWTNRTTTFSEMIASLGEREIVRDD